MKTLKSIFVAAALVLGTAAVASVQSDDAKVGTAVDASGIVLSGLNQKPLPLPPGQWRIVGRIEHDLVITYPTDADIVTPMVALTLLNEDKTSPVVVAVIDYPSNQVHVRWRNAVCDAGKAQYAETFGTTTGTIQYGCAKLYSRSNDSFKKYLQGLPSKSQYWQARFKPLTPYIDGLPESYNWNDFYFNLNRGRTLTATLITKANTDGKAGDAADVAARDFLRVVGQAYLNWVSNEDASIPAYPAH
ncbi:MAG: hypothetical protein WA136_08215 [Rhodoferax sp.]